MDCGVGSANCSKCFSVFPIFALSKIATAPDELLTSFTNALTTNSKVCNSFWTRDPCSNNIDTAFSEEGRSSQHNMQVSSSGPLPEPHSSHSHPPSGTSSPTSSPRFSCKPSPSPGLCRHANHGCVLSSKSSLHKAASSLFVRACANTARMIFFEPAVKFTKVSISKEGPVGSTVVDLRTPSAALNPSKLCKRTSSSPYSSPTKCDRSA